MKQTHAQAIESAYDIIAAIFQKQEGIVPFVDCYGDGTRFLPLTKKGVGIVWHEMVSMVEKGKT